MEIHLIYLFILIQCKNYCNTALHEDALYLLRSKPQETSSISELTL